MLSLDIWMKRSSYVSRYLDSSGFFYNINNKWFAPHDSLHHQNRPWCLRRREPLIPGFHKGTKWCKASDGQIMTQRIISPKRSIISTYSHMIIIIYTNNIFYILRFGHPNLIMKDAHTLHMIKEWKRDMFYNAFHDHRMKTIYIKYNNMNITYIVNSSRSTVELFFCSQSKHYGVW